MKTIEVRARQNNDETEESVSLMIERGSKKEGASLIWRMDINRRDDMYSQPATLADGEVIMLCHLRYLDEIGITVDGARHRIVIVDTTSSATTSPLVISLKMTSLPGHLLWITPSQKSNKNHDLHSQRLSFHLPPRDNAAADKILRQGSRAADHKKNVTSSMLGFWAIF